MSQCSTNDYSKLTKNNSRNSDHTLLKRDPLKYKNTSLVNIYANNQSSLKCQVEKCDKILKEQNEVIVHGLGNAVPIAINLALQLNTRHSNTLNLEVNTSTVKLVDDLEPTSEEGEYKTQVRNNSSIHIKIKHNVPKTG